MVQVGVEQKERRGEAKANASEHCVDTLQRFEKSDGEPAGREGDGWEKWIHGVDDRNLDAKNALVLQGMGSQWVGCEYHGRPL